MYVTTQPTVSITPVKKPKNLATPTPAPTPKICLKAGCNKASHDFGNVGKSYYCKECLYDLWEQESGFD